MTTLGIYVHLLEKDVPEADVFDSLWIEGGHKVDTDPAEIGRSAKPVAMAETALLRAISS